MSLLSETQLIIPAQSWSVVVLHFPTQTIDWFKGNQ